MTEAFEVVKMLVLGLSAGVRTGPPRQRDPSRLKVIRRRPPAQVVH
jgi:hypothetical protein